MRLPFRHGSVLVLLVGFEPTHKLFLRQLPTSSWATGANGRDGRIRTYASLVPNQGFLTTELHPDLVLLVGLEPTHKLLLRQPPTSNWATGAWKKLVLLMGFEPTRGLFLRQPPLPIGLQE